MRFAADGVADAAVPLFARAMFTNGTLTYSQAGTVLGAIAAALMPVVRSLPPIALTRQPFIFYAIDEKLRKHSKYAHFQPS